MIYLDPPFNSSATYNVLFKTPKGHQSEAQIEAFDDTWHWGPNAEAAFANLMQQSNDREKAAMGFFVTLTDPTRNMVTEGVGTGYYLSPLTGAQFPRLQVLTIEGLLSGRE